MTLITITGLAGVTIVALTFYRCWILNDKFSFKTQPLSYAARTHTKHVFIFYVVSIAIVQSMFIFLLLTQSVPTPSYLLWLVMSSLAALSLAGIIHPSISETFHNVFITYAIAGLTIWSLLWHMHIFEHNFWIATLGFVLSALVAVGCTVLLAIYKRFGMSEILFGSATIAWNVAMITFAITV